MIKYNKRLKTDKQVNLFLDEKLFIKIKNHRKKDNKTLKSVLSEIVDLGYKLYKRRY